MDKYKIATVHVRGAEARVVDLKEIPRGIRGACVEFLYDDPMWAAMAKNITFHGARSVSVADAGTIVDFPSAVAAKANRRISVGICGVGDSGQTIMPTVLASLGTVLESAEGEYPAPEDEQPEFWAKIQSEVHDLKGRAEELEEQVEELENGSSGGGLTVTDDGEGNVTITASGSAQITDDGSGNVVIS